MGTNTEAGFAEYRHHHIPVNGVPAVTFKFEVNYTYNKLKVSFATCSPKDNFDRKIGRKIADERMDKGEFVVFDYDNTLSLNQNIGNYLIGIMSEEIPPPQSVPVRELTRAFYYLDYITQIRNYSQALTEQMVGDAEKEQE